MALLMKMPNGGSQSLKVIAEAIGEPATEKDKKERLAELIDAAQADIAAACNEKGCSIPAHPTFPEIIDGIGNISHFTRPPQISGLSARGGHDTAGKVSLSWSNPADAKFKGVKILYKTGGYPTGPADGTVAYDGKGTSVEVSGLSHGSTYYFRAFSYNIASDTYIYNNSTIGAQCTGIPALNVPAQISNLRATVGSTVSGYVKLTWTNPSDTKFKGVRILYKTGSYPTSPSDGTVLYTGTGTTVEKTGLANGTAYYFRAFAYNLSNGIYAYATAAAQCTATPYINKGRQVFTESGTFTVPFGVKSVDVFLVGGGSGGNRTYNYPHSGGGGGSGKTLTKKAIAVTPNEKYTVVIGAGGAGCNENMNDWGLSGGETSITIKGATYTAQPGMKDTSKTVPCGVNGGSGGGGTASPDWPAKAGNGGSDGGDGVSVYSPGGKGQGTTTREFGEASGTLYAGGGGGGAKGAHTSNGDIGGAGGAGGGGNGANIFNGAPYRLAEPGTPNTGGGGGGGNSTNGPYSGESAAGGSGVAIVRWGY